MLKNLKNKVKAGYAIGKYAVLSPYMRELAVNFLGSMAVVCLIDDYEEDAEEGSLAKTGVYRIPALLAGMLLSYSAAKALDGVLEKHDIEVYNEFVREMKALGY